MSSWPLPARIKNTFSEKLSLLWIIYVYWEKHFFGSMGNTGFGKSLDRHYFCPETDVSDISRNILSKNIFHYVSKTERLFIPPPSLCCLCVFRNLTDMLLFWNTVCEREPLRVTVLEHCPWEKTIQSYCSGTLYVRENHSEFASHPRDLTIFFQLVEDHRRWYSLHAPFPRFPLVLWRGLADSSDVTTPVST